MEKVIKLFEEIIGRKATGNEIIFLEAYNTHSKYISERDKLHIKGLIDSVKSALAIAIIGTLVTKSKPDRHYFLLIIKKIMKYDSEDDIYNVKRLNAFYYIANNQ